MIKHQKQRFEYDRVIYEIGAESFMTQRGIVVEGNFRIGDKVLLVFDTKSKRYLPSFKREKPPPHEEELLLVSKNRGLSCLITILDLPIAVPPMRWYAPGTETFTKGEGGWVIKTPGGTLEIEGKDYIKTYYRATLINCPDCSPVAFTLCETGTYDLTLQACHPFIYESDGQSGKPVILYQGLPVPHFMGYDWTTPHTPANPIIHTIYSLSSCQAEIIKFDSDAAGTYFLWKAHTEWSVIPEVVTFSRTGLGYMLMQGFIKNMGVTICESDPGIIKVDCCLKPVAERTVKLWWESLSGYEIGGPTCTGQPFMFYGSIKICEVPAEVFGLYSLLCVSWMGYHSKTFFAIPEINGSCVPLTWEMSGPAGLTIVPAEPNGEMAELWATNAGCEALGDCHVTVVVTVTDRCGTKDQVTFLPCCTQLERGGIPPLSIGYTSLQMGCGQSQDLAASGGCGPYTWSCGGLGSLSATTGSTVTYTAPPTNPGCGNNDTVTLTDCCGNSSTVTFYVSCNVAGVAYRDCSALICDDECPDGGFKASFCSVIWGCQGTLIGEDAYRCGGNPAECNCSGNFGWCMCPTSGWMNPCGGIGLCGSPDQPCGTTMDLRTSQMKADGCCPVNPLTGLPF